MPIAPPKEVAGMLRVLQKDPDRHDDPSRHLVLADKLEDYGDPRAALVRQHAALPEMGSGGFAWQRLAELVGHNPFEGELHPAHERSLPDGTTLRFKRYGSGRRFAYHVEWLPGAHNSGFAYRAAMTPREFLDFLRGFGRRLRIPGVRRLSRPTVPYKINSRDRELVEGKVREMFGPGFTTHDVVHAAGIPQGGRANVDWLGRSINVSGLAGPNGGHAHRTFMRNPDTGELELHNTSVYNDPKDDGVGVSRFLRQVNAARRLGIKTIHATAAGFAAGREGWNSTMNGYYTWPAMGFDADLGHHLERIEREEPGLHAKIKDNPTLSNLFSTPEGRDYWRHRGDTLHVTFDTSPGSDSWKRLIKYLKERVKRTDRTKPFKFARLHESMLRPFVDSPDFRDGDRTAHLALADAFQEVGDPREDLVRDTAAHPALLRPIYSPGHIPRPGEMTADRYGRYLTLPDGTQLNILRYEEGGRGLRYNVTWCAGAHSFDKSMTTEELRDWLRRFRGDRTRALPQARMRAPADGMIVNNQFYQGGKFIPAAFKKIRDVAARLRSVRRLARRGPPLAASHTLGFDPSQDRIHPAALKKIEDDLDLPAGSRISHLPVQERTEKKIRQFIDAVTDRRLTDEKLRATIREPGHPDAKVLHLINHLAHEAVAGGNGGKGWYGPAVDEFETGVRRLLGWQEPRNKKDPPWVREPRMTLLKAVVAGLSGNTNPSQNAVAAYRVIDAAQKIDPLHPFRHLPEYNQPALDEFKTLNPDAGDPGTDQLARNLWALKYGRGSSAGYMSGKTQVVDRPGHPDHGRAVAEYKNDEWVGMTPDAGRLIHGHGFASKGGHIRTVLVPLVDSTGRLQPKGWTSRREEGASKIRAVKDLVKRYEGIGMEYPTAVAVAAKTLLTEFPEAAFRTIAPNADLKESQLEPGEKVPGAFVLGPKFGAFLLNLHANDQSEAARFGKYLTADMWWTRSWKRLLKSLHPETRDAPKAEERRVMLRVAKEAAKKAGLPSVADLQAVIWYYEQNLWRWLGAAGVNPLTLAHGVNRVLAEKSGGQGGTTPA